MRHRSSSVKIIHRLHNPRTHTHTHHPHFIMTSSRPRIVSEPMNAINHQPTRDYTPSWAATRPDPRHLSSDTTARTLIKHHQSSSSSSSQTLVYKLAVDRQLSHDDEDRHPSSRWLSNWWNGASASSDVGDVSPERVVRELSQDR